MTKFITAGIAALALSPSVWAGWGENRTPIIHSGNGAYNTIGVFNHAPILFPYPAPTPAFGGYPGYGHGYGPPVGGSPFPLLQGVLNAVGGVNFNIIRNSGNGVGNSIRLGNGGRPGGININFISDSGNGAGNSINIRNRR